MARIRTIKPEFWIDERVGECSPTARLLFIATWNFADDNGNLERSSRQLKAQAMPYDNVDCEQLLSEIIGAGLLEEYSVNGSKYLHVTNFEKHQKIEKKSAARHPLPNPSPTPTQLVGIGREGKVKEVEGGSENPPRDLTELEYARFFWEALGLPFTSQNLTICGSAIKSYAGSSKIELRQAAELILDAAKADKLNGITINRFWLEDGKYLPQHVKPIRGECEKHKGSGVTNSGECNGCYYSN